MKFWDISPLISAKTAVFPGDVPFSRDISLDFKTGHHLLLSSIASTLHIGAHTDASNHYDANGSGIEARDLRMYLGLCQVIEVSLPKGARIFPKDIHVEISAPRVLFRTNSFPNPDSWNDDFNSLSPELVAFLAAKKVCLVGIDTPSVDPADSKELESHHAIFSNDLGILEGIILEKVPAGLYTLIALPLKLKDADASPVRAILLEKDALHV
jgi:arylformamidase